MHSFYFDLFGHMGLGPHGKELLLYLKQTIIYLHQDKQGLSFTVLAVPCLVCIWLLDFQAKSIRDEMQRQCRSLISLHLTIKLGSIIQLHVIMCFPFLDGGLVHLHSAHKSSSVDVSPGKTSFLVDYLTIVYKFLTQTNFHLVEF